jgi:tetratricopeptide (TPR) repeat protein
MQKLIVLQKSGNLQKDTLNDHYIIDNILSNPVSDTIKKILVDAFECAEDGDYLESLKLYDLALKDEPNNIEALIDKGVTLQNIGKHKLAIRSYDKALSISPDNMDALLNKGSALHSDQKFIEAITCYDLALKIDKKCAMALAYKGLSLGEMGQLHDAINHFKKALSIDKHYDLANISKNLAQDLLKSISEQKSKTL